MALLHQATLSPSKLELLTEHLAGQIYLDGADLTGLSQLGAYRFDDPANEVGVETHLLSCGSVPVIQVPLTYRGTPLDGAEQWLVGTMEHTVLGKRWVYNGVGDPVYVSTLINTISSGGTQAELTVDTPEGLTTREPTVLVNGSGNDANSEIEATEFTSRPEGTTTVISTGAIELTVRHLLDDSAIDDACTASLSGTWPGNSEPVWLACLSQTPQAQD